MNILKDSNKKNHVRCPHCGRAVKRDGCLLNGKFYHSVCADAIMLTMACRENGEPKRVYIAG